jgi:uncharacterized protein (TIGR03437 family)
MFRKLSLAVWFGAMTVSSVWAQPSVNDGGILNAASYASPRLPTGAVAQGSIFVIFGGGMGPAALVQASSLPLSDTLGGTAVRVTSGGQTLNCPMIYTSAGQVAAVMPSTTPVGNATLTVTFNGATSATRSVRVAASSFGTFTINQRGSGPGVITNFDSPSAQPVNTVLKPARPGQTVILYGTGLGPLPAGTPDNAAAPAVQINNNSIEVLVGSRRATVSYAGRAPGFVGLDQINFVVPPDVLGCAVSVLIRVGTQVSNATTMAVSTSGGVCSDPLGLPSSALERLSNGQSLKYGAISLSRFTLDLAIPGIGSFSSTSDSGAADFNEITPQNVIQSASLNVGGVPSIGSCIVYTVTLDDLTPEDPIAYRGLDAGPQLTINGPRGAKTFTKSTVTPFDGFYTANLGGGVALPGLPAPEPPYLESGNYTITGPGGADVGAFTAQYTIGAQLVWSNRDTTNAIARASGQLVTWTGGGANDFVFITGYSASDTTDNSITGGFICIERASAQRFTIPAAILLAIPASPSGGGLGTPLGVLAVGSIFQERTFNAPGLDIGVVTSSSIAAKSVNYN